VLGLAPDTRSIRRPALGLLERVEWGPIGWCQVPVRVMFRGGRGPHAAGGLGERRLSRIIRAGLGRSEAGGLSAGDRVVERSGLSTENS